MDRIRPGQGSVSALPQYTNQSFRPAKPGPDITPLNPQGAPSGLTAPGPRSREKAVSTPLQPFTGPGPAPYAPRFYPDPRATPTAPTYPNTSYQVAPSAQDVYYLAPSPRSSGASGSTRNSQPVRGQQHTPTYASVQPPLSAKRNRAETAQQARRRDRDESDGDSSESDGDSSDSEAGDDDIDQAVSKGYSDDGEAVPLAAATPNSNNDSRAIVPEVWKFIGIVIQRHKVTIRLGFWYWSRVRTDAKLLEHGISAHSMLSLESGKTIDGYTMRERDFFSYGRVFAIPWSRETQPVVTDDMQRSLRMPKPVVSRSTTECIFVVVFDSNGEMCSTLPVRIYHRSTPEVRLKTDGGMVYTPQGGLASSLVDELPLKPVCLVTDDTRMVLDPLSWVDYGALCSITAELPVRSIGTIHPASLPVLWTQFVCIQQKLSAERHAACQSTPTQGMPSTSFTGVRRGLDGSAREYEASRRPQGSQPTTQLSDNLAGMRIASVDAAASGAGPATPSHARIDSATGTTPEAAATAQWRSWLMGHVRAAGVSLTQELSPSQIRHLANSPEARQVFINQLRAARTR